MTVITVGANQKSKPSSEELGIMLNRFINLSLKLKAGTLSPEHVLDGIQLLSEGKVMVDNLMEEIVCNAEIGATDSSSLAGLNDIGAIKFDPSMYKPGCHVDVGSYVSDGRAGKVLAFEITRSGGTKANSIWSQLLWGCEDFEVLEASIIQELGGWFTPAQIFELWQRFCDNPDICSDNTFFLCRTPKHRLILVEINIVGPTPMVILHHANEAVLHKGNRLIIREPIED